MFTKEKDPQAVLPYSINWTTWLGGETITASTWTVAEGITKDSDSFSGTVAIIWLSGGTAGTDYLVTNHVTTDGGREDDRSILILVRQR